MQHKQGPGGKPAKRRFGKLFTTKELYGVAQETRGSIVGIYASPITIPVHVHVVLGLQYQRPYQCSTDMLGTVWQSQDLLW